MQVYDQVHPSVSVQISCPDDLNVVATDDARHAVVDAVRANAHALNASREQMSGVEEMRRTVREIKDVNKLDSN